MKACRLIVAVALFALVGCAATDNNKKIPVGEEITVERTTFSFDQEKAPYDLFRQYTMQPGDVLDVLFQIRTWTEKAKFVLAVDHTIEIKFIHAPELDQLQRVRPDGTISMPYIGALRVVGKTIDELSAEIEEKYSKILKHPSFYIRVPEFQSSIKELKADLHTAPRGLSRLVTIRPDGYVTFPMVGDVFASGKSLPEVNAFLNEKYEAILPGLHCDLFLEHHSGSVVYVVGEVKEPGSFPVVKPITILEAITRAGSATSAAEMESVMVVRRHEGEMVATRVNVADSLDFTTAGSFFFLQPDDIVIVPKTHLARSAEVSNYIANILFFRGWSIGVGPNDLD